jgi:hypothetical protein
LETLTARIEQASTGGDASKIQTLGEQYTATATALEAAMEEWADLAQYVE